MAAAFKKEAHKLIDAMPETASWDDLAEKAKYLAAVERGIEAADRGEFASPDRIRAMFAKWGVDAEA
jgi:predicted transcriptional regulator